MLTLEGSSQWIDALAFSRDGRSLASFDRGGTIFLWANEPAD